MKSEQIRDEINKLSITEKLQLIGSVWDDIAASQKQLPLPEWQKQALDQRYQAYRERRLELFDAESVHEDLRNKYKN